MALYHHHHLHLHLPLHLAHLPYYPIREALQAVPQMAGGHHKVRQTQNAAKGGRETRVDVCRVGEAGRLAP